MILNYKGYRGSVEYDCEDHIYYGKAENVPWLISYMGTTWEDLVANFMEAVDVDIEEGNEHPP